MAEEREDVLVKFLRLLKHRKPLSPTLDLGVAALEDVADVEAEFVVGAGRCGSKDFEGGKQNFESI